MTVPRSFAAWPAVITLETPPGDELAQHGVQPADDLGAAPAQVAVPLGPRLQHRRVIVGPDLPDTGRPQRRHGNRPGIVRVVLVHIAGGQQPDPRAQLGLDVQHPLTRRHQLLGQQVAHPPGILDRPGALRPRRGPPQQLLRLPGAGTDPQLTQFLLCRADHHRVCEALCGSIPIITAGDGMYLLTLDAARGPWRARLISDKVVVTRNLPGQGRSSPSKPKKGRPLRGRPFPFPCPSRSPSTHKSAPAAGARSGKAPAHAHQNAARPLQRGQSSHLQQRRKR